MIILILIALMAAAFLCHPNQSAMASSIVVPPGADIFATARTRKELRILYSGSSVSCGPPYASSYETGFPMLLAHKLERQLEVKVSTMNICYGGSYSITQLAALKYEGLPWKPDLVIAEIGTLDALNQVDSSSAVESFCRVIIAASIPFVIVYPQTQYAAIPKKVVTRIARHYGIPMIDIAAWAQAMQTRFDAISSDHLHMNDRGQEIA